jgi:hypothetical protein
VIPCRGLVTVAAAICDACVPLLERHRKLSDPKRLAKRHAVLRPFLFNPCLLTALDYLIGEKLLTYAESAVTRPEFARELPRFVAEVRYPSSTMIRRSLGELQLLAAGGSTLRQPQWHRRRPPRQRLPHRIWSQSARRRPISRAESGSRRRSGAGPNDTAEARCFAASGSPGFACGAEARNAGPAFGFQQHPVDAGSCGWAVGHQSRRSREDMDIAMVLWRRGGGASIFPPRPVPIKPPAR